MEKHPSVWSPVILLRFRLDIRKKSHQVGSLTMEWVTRKGVTPTFEISKIWLEEAAADLI